MHIDVDETRIDPDVDHRHRVTAAFKPSLIALLEGVQERSRCYRPAVDRKDDAVATPTAQSWLGDHASHQRHTDDIEELGCHCGAIYGRDRSASIAVARGADCSPAFKVQLETDVGMKECIRAHNIFDGSQLG